MSFEDFCKNLTSVGICKVEGDNLYNFIEIKEPKGVQMSMVRFQVNRQAKYSLTVDQKDPRNFALDDIYVNPYIRLTIGKFENSKQIKFYDCKFSPEDTMFIESEFPAGDYIALIETYWRGPNQ